MDPVTAFATAQAAVAGIKKAIQLGKDINGLIGEFSRFFDARDIVQKAANDKAKAGQSDTARAMEIVMQAQQLREAEEQLKHELIYGGYPELWNQMLKERIKIRQEREKAEREERVAAARARQKAIDIAMGVTAAVAFVGSLLAIVWAVFAILDSGR